MATAKNVEDSSIESGQPPMSSSDSSESEGELEYTDKKSLEIYTCIICHEIIDGYVELPCHHIGCEKCIQKWGKTTFK